jgi:3D (Asp-Asp-Asp) domain-containing protein
LRLDKLAKYTKLGAAVGVLIALIVGLLPGTTVIVGADDTPIAKVKVVVDGQEYEWVTSEKTVGAVLAEIGITLGEKDRVNYKLTESLYSGMEIKVTRITEKLVVQREPIKYATRIKYIPGIKVNVGCSGAGIPGEKEVTYLVTYKDGKKAHYKAISSKVIKKPVDQVVGVSVLSRIKSLSSRAGVRSACLRMVATAYAPFHCGGSKSGRTATGMMAGKGVVAVDPRVIPLGTRLYIEGYGYAIAGDTGGAIKGNRIDLGFNTYREAVRFGRRTVTVYILD